MPPDEPFAARPARVTRDYTAQYADPLAVAAGEPFAMSARRDAWEGNPAWIWVWCSAADGRSGWVPESRIQPAPDGTTGTTAAPYDARELTVTAGQVLPVEDEAAGWAWCRTAGGRHGWVPHSHLDGDAKGPA